MPDYKSDVATIIDAWKTRVTLKRNVPTFGDIGGPTHVWTTITTADVDIQPANEKKLAYMAEIGIKEVYSHVIYGYYNTSAVKLAPELNDRFYDASNKIYEIKQIKEYENSHIEMYCIYVEGKV